MIDPANPIDMPVFFPFGRPGDFLVNKPRSTEDLVRKLYGDEVEFHEIPQMRFLNPSPTQSSQRQQPIELSSGLWYLETLDYRLRNSLCCLHRTICHSQIESS